MPRFSPPVRAARDAEEPAHRSRSRLFLTLQWALLAPTILLALGATPGWAQTPPPASSAGGVTVTAGGEEATIVADEIQQVGGANELLIAVGNVEITRGQTRLLADRVELNRDTGQAVAQGKAVFYDGPDRLVGERIDYNLKTGTGAVFNGSSFSAPYYHLSADRMDRIGESVYEVHRGVFTTCEGDEPAWSFRFNSGTADLEDILYGQNASFWVKNAPVLPWIPFFAAALRRERQSGFLFPEYGESSRKGYFTRVPYFWAINDSQDLTLTLDAFSKRGFGLEADYRYILSRDQQGELLAFGVNEGLRSRSSSPPIQPGVPRAPDNSVPENRGWVSLKHDWQITPRLAFKVDSVVTTDDAIFRDYGNTLGERGAQYARTNVSLTQRWNAWSLVGNVLWYQDLTTPFPSELQRAPSIALTGVRQPVPGASWLQYETSAQFVNFVRYLGPEGIRADFHPRFFLPIPVAGLFTLTPFGGGRLTYYDQRVTGGLHFSPLGVPSEESVYDPRVRRQIEGGVEAQTRIQRVFTTDGTGGIAALQHVFEPRARVIEIRGIDQKDMPSYEPGARTATAIDPGYEALHGIDGIGKANEVTYYLTNILNAKTTAGPNQQPIRWELMRFTLSQTYNFKPISQPVGDLYGDLSIRPNERIRLHADARYNVYGLGLREANADIGAEYPRFSFAVGPRFNEQASARTMRAQVQVQVLPTVNLRASTYWDVTHGLAVETRAGIDWRFSCWAILVEYVNRNRQESEFRFSVNLLGLGEAGTSARSGF
jgi:LPS-assembly protein